MERQHSSAKWKMIHMNWNDTNPMKQHPAPVQAQHSPLPWKVEHDEGANQAIVTSEARNVCSLEDYYNDGEANAALIVRACNNYEELQVKYAKLWEQRYNARAHARRLADALSTIHQVAREALAEWSKQK